MSDKVIEFPKPVDEDKEMSGTHIFYFNNGQDPVTIEDSYLVITPAFAAVGRGGVIYHAAPWTSLVSVGRVV